MNFKRWLGLVGDFGGYNFGGQSAGVGGQLYTYAFGPRFTRRGGRAWVPFGQILAGGARVNGTLNGQSASENGFSLIAGGGLDARFRPAVSFRVFEFDYLMTRFDRVTGTNGLQNDFRFSAGVVFNLGRRE